MVKGYCLRCRLCFLRREWGLAPLCGAAATFSGRSKDPSRPWERRCFSVRYRGAKGCLHLSVRPHCFAKHKTFGLSVMLWCESLRAYHSPSAIFCLTSALLHLPSFSKPLTTVWRQSASPLTFKSGAKVRQRHCGLKFLSNFFQKIFFEGGQIGQGQIGQIENRMSFSAHNNNKILFYYILWHFLPCGNEFDQNDHDQNDRKTISISLWLSAAKC